MSRFGKNTMCQLQELETPLKRFHPLGQPETSLGGVTRLRLTLRPAIRYSMSFSVERSETPPPWPINVSAYCDIRDSISQIDIRARYTVEVTRTHLKTPKDPGLCCGPTKHAHDRVCPALSLPRALSASGGLVLNPDSHFLDRFEYPDIFKTSDPLVANLKQSPGSPSG